MTINLDTFTAHKFADGGWNDKPCGAEFPPPLFTQDQTEFKCPGCENTLLRACDDCKEWKTVSDWEQEGSGHADLTDATLCEGCYQSDTEAASTLIRFAPTEKAEKVIFGDNVCYSGTLDEIYDSEAPQWFKDVLPENWTGRVWVSSSGWRGYYATDKVLKLTSIEDGWMTGDYSDVPWKKDTHAFLEALSDGDIVPPKPVYILFEPTSNVFSTATTILAAPDDVDTVREWLEGSGYDLHKALS